MADLGRYRKSIVRTLIIHSQPKWLDSALKASNFELGFKNCIVGFWMLLRIYLFCTSASKIWIDYFHVQKVLEMLSQYFYDVWKKHYWKYWVLKSILPFKNVQLRRNDHMQKLNLKEKSKGYTHVSKLSQGTCFIK